MMRDCANAEIRDLLPDLIHGKLDALERERVERHVRACSDCAIEVKLIERARAVVDRATPKVNAAQIAAALPSTPRVAEPVFGRARRLQLAAAIVVAVLGAGVAREIVRDDPAQTSVTARPAVVVAEQPSVPALPAERASVRPSGMTIVAGLDELSVPELEILVASLGSLEATPTAEPEQINLTGLEIDGEIQ